ncbi:MAG: HlyD family efflux transporter periplasmic adaptor subunit [Burkholderiales bacterium]|nr:HlyD family efflux transporter periplasmic adaptor subunit [Opitutaceae bacterium]
MNPPLAPADYLVPADQLPRARAAAWMSRILVLTGALSLLTTVAVVFGPMHETVPMSGEIRPAAYTYASPLSAGTVKQIFIKESDPVVTGTLLATLDNWSITRDLAQLTADLDQARAEFTRVEATSRKTTAVPVPSEFLFSAREVEKQRDLLVLQREHLDRTEKLERQGSASSVDVMNLRMQLLASEALLARYERAADLTAGAYGQSAVAEAKAAHAVAAAKVASLETRRSGLEAERARLEIRAPRDGVVTATATLYPGLAVTPGQALFKIAASGDVVLRLRATEDRIGSLRPGQLVRFRARSDPDRLSPYSTARLTRVAPDRALTSSLETDQPGDYLVDAVVETTARPLPSGANVDAEVVLSTQPLYRRWFQTR